MADRVVVGLPFMGNNLWTFGNVYQNDLIRLLQKYDPGRYQFVMMVPQSQEGMVKERLDGVMYRTYTDYKVEFTLDPSKLIFNGMAYLFGRTMAINAAIKGVGIDALFGPYIGQPSVKVGTLTWIPDFQHIHYPEMFQKEERESRSNSIRKVAETADRVILISQSAKDDYCAFAPEYKDKARVFSPMAYIDEGFYESNTLGVVEKYNVPEEYIFLPNQFWKHKDHCTVVKALKILKDNGTEATVVCAGNSHDYRNPGYFSELMKQVAEMGLQRRFIYIGLIQKPDVLALMRESVCVMNPSLFEGYGFTVDEARSIGKPLILSDINPHNEQNPPESYYFKPGDPEELAHCIGKAWSEYEAGPNYAMEREAISEYSARAQKTAESFRNLIGEVTE